MFLTASNISEGFGNVLFFAVFGAIFVFINLYVLGKLILRRPHRPDEGQKSRTYECAEPAIGDAWIRFDIRFYSVALIFLIFDIEVAMLFPWASVFESFVEGGHGVHAFLGMLFFVAILAVGLAYDWIRKDLEWTSTRPGRAVSEETLRDAVVTPPARLGEREEEAA